MTAQNFKLNTEQQNLVAAVKSLKKGGRLIGSGRAGSGKTFAISRSVEDRKALFLAPTHPAKAILERELSGTGHRVMTIQGAIGWKKEYAQDGLTPVNTYRPAWKAKNGRSKSPFGDAEIIIVDESSMVGKFLFNATEDYANEFGLPVVYSGDPLQLPPVNDEEVIHLQGFETIALQESMRFSKDSRIFGLGEELRNSIQHHTNQPFECIFGGGDVEVVSAADWTAGAKTDYAKGASMLAVTSDNRKQRALRAHIRGADDDRLRAGDVVISKQTDELFRNGQISKVLKVEPGQKTLPDVPKCLGLKGELIVNGFYLTFEDCISPAFVFANDDDRGKLRRRVNRLF